MPAEARLADLHAGVVAIGEHAHAYASCVQRLFELCCMHINKRPW